MDFKLPPLKYSYDALEPYIDEATMREHHDKHHKKYVDELNKISPSAPRGRGLHDMLGGLKKKDSMNLGFHTEDLRILENHGGGHFNHSLFWEFLSNTSKESEISATLMERLRLDYGSLEDFKRQFAEKTLKIFGSGWCWLVFDQSDIGNPKTFIMATKDQENPIMFDSQYVPLLGLDVWEHAYYLTYKSNRALYVGNWWKVVNWRIVSDIFDDIAIMNRRLAITKEGFIDFTTDSSN